APTTPTGDPAPTVAAQGVDFAAADSQLEQALIAGQTATIEQILAKLDQNAAQAKALRRKAELWTSRADILGSIIRSRKPKLRLPHPTIGEQWDVTDAERGGVQITSPAGSSTRLEWTQVALKDLGRIAREAADHPQAESRDYALACVLLLMSGDTALASVQTIKGKAAIDEPTARDLDALIALKRGREVDHAIMRADAAATQGDLKALDDALAALKRLDRDKQPRAHDALSRLDPVRARLAEGKTTASDVAAKDDLAFDEEDDLQSFPLRQGVWHVGNGQVNLVGESGSLARKDMANARSLTVTFQNNGGKGAMTINFRGVRVLAEFGGNRITVASREQESRGKEFVFLPKTVHSIYLRANREAGTMAIEVNNGAEVFELKTGALSEQLMISADNNAAIAIEELSIGRDGSHQPGNDPATTARHEAVRNQTGCEPLGGVYLDPPTIVLPAPDKGVESGLAFMLRESATSITVDVKGKGQLQFLLGQVGKDGGDFVNVDLKPDPQRLTISWRGALVVKNEQGLVIAENKNLGKDHSHLMILAANEAIMMVSPKLNRE
ncbi:MAG: hypothetical protein H0X45_05015, partial [Planctomycetes bacterium]|nr:hypothetical protein [Planctomycetota bacterium]